MGATAAEPVARAGEPEPIRRSGSLVVPLAWIGSLPFFLYATFFLLIPAGDVLVGAFRDDSGHWFRSYGNENWEFGNDGLMKHRHASINDLPIKESERKFFWALGRRPDDHPGLSELGL